MKNKVLFISLMAYCSFVAQSQKKPNIILIYADDLGFGDVGCYNPQSKIKTPNIDKLAKAGVRFIDAHSSSTISSPSRYGILTGAYSWRTSRKRGNPLPGKQPWISEERTTIANLLQDNGYNTAAFSKWGLGADWNAAAKPQRKGLDISAESIDYTKPVFAAKPVGFNYECLNLWYARYADTLYSKQYESDAFLNANKKYTDGGRWYFENGMSQGGVPDFQSFDMEEAQEYFLDKTLDYIDVAGGRSSDPTYNINVNKPFFIYYASAIPHYPLVPAKQFKGKSSVGLYGDYVMQLDWTVGEITKALERNNLLDNTIIIFSSDNGPESQTYDYIKKYNHYSMGDFRGVKRDLYEGGHRIPFIVSYPQKFKTGVVSNHLVSQTDILRTVADFLDIKVCKKYAEDSFSFLNQLIVSKETPTPERNVIIYHSANGNLALRRDSWVLINAKQGNNNAEPAWIKEKNLVVNHSEDIELYNLDDDPKQLKNIAKQHPNIAFSMMRELLKYVYDGRSYYNQKTITK